ncbi:hypothetical protein KJ693_10000 [bacterium]|nr:hypothetical protein [bacterium]MBU1615621.1 hypothetical protein [bacterium]
MCKSKLMLSSKDLGDEFEGVKEGFVDYLFKGVNPVRKGFLTGRAVYADGLFR